MRHPSTTTHITREGFKIAGRYVGGEYIDIHINNHTTPVDVINVWDYREGKSKLHINDMKRIRALLAEWYSAQVYELLTTSN